MKRSCLALLILFFTANVYAQFSVSENKRFILRNNQPFFYLGDTGWELFHRLTREEADQYLKKRAEQGFTVIQAVVLAEMDGMHSPNAYGDIPFENDDLSKPVEAYFKHVDYIIDKANEYGLVIGLLPTWGDKIDKSTWGKGPEIFTTANAKKYGAWIASRYKNRNNIIWILGGDRNPRNEQDVTIWRNMASGITEAYGKAHPMITFHPQPTEKGSATWFMNDEWLSFNMFQNGHCRNITVYDKIKSLYTAQPVKPVMDGEPLYEDHPVCFNVKELGKSSAYDVRLYAYLELFAGAHGHTYGCHDIWQFYGQRYEPVNGPGMYWTEALNLPGAGQMIYVKKLIMSRPFLDRIPDQSLIVENNLTAAERIQATRGKDYAFVYTAAGKPFTVNGRILSGEMLKANWYNPRNGKLTAAGEFPNKGQHVFTPPSSGYGQDWVLMVDDAAATYSAP